MKTIILSIAVLGSCLLSAQFKVNIEASDSFDKSATIYTLNGSKYSPIGKMIKKEGKWTSSISQQYRGIMKAYFPTANKTILFISENKDVNIKLNTSGSNIIQTTFIDEANNVWKQVYDNQQKQDVLLPTLIQIKQFYSNGSEFDIALSKEIATIQNSQNISLGNYPFIKFFKDNNHFASKIQNEHNKISSDKYVDFLVNSSEYLETSSLLRNVLINYLQSLSTENPNKEIDYLLDKANINTNRGQNILSELLSIFDSYGLKELHNKYYQLATSIKGNVNPTLKESIDAIKRNSIGMTFTNYTFSKTAKNTRAKSIKDIKANKKVILFWSSTCPHCLSELPIISENYNKLKAKNIEVIALSFDNDKQNYERTIANLPWIQDAELKGWESSYSKTYNVNATPTYYVLDSNNKIIEKPNNFSEFLSSNNIK